MSKIAFDIAILPPENIQDICVELCNKYANNSGQLRLNKIDNLTHISLFMGMTEKNDLPDMFERVEKITNNLGTLKLELETLKKINNTHFFVVKKTPELQNLHEKIVNELKDYKAKNTTADMFFDEKIDESTFFWTDNYITGSSFQKFWPHITLKGCAKPKYDDLPKKFIADKIAICHLGDHCTCRKILWETNLKPNT
ncbi:hypothetical protein KJ785_04545 [Patescibacteria group bacterium]|nr:hypothetical protein [Patescibacteria group bacterium]